MNDDEKPSLRPRSYAPVARSDSTFLEGRVGATRWSATELARHIPTSPRFRYGPVSKEALDALVQEYVRITNDPVRRPKKRDLIAACYRVHGEDFLPFVADYFRVEGTAQNLLGVIRRAEPRVGGDDGESAHVEVGADTHGARDGR